MEKIKIISWLQDNHSGDGSGYGSGEGWGDGSGYGSGEGWGDGSGYGSGEGCGYGWGDGSGYGSGEGCGYGSGEGCGYGWGYGISFFCGKDVFVVNNVATIITGIQGNLARGYILNQDFTLYPCYVVKDNGYFAHGETAEEANNSLREKIFENMDEEEAIDKFTETFKPSEKYPCKMFYEWHHYLTGSCEMGRKSFMRDHGITMDDTFSVSEFIELCENDYGGDIIKRLKEHYAFL